MILKISFHKIAELYQKQLERETSTLSKDYIEKILEYVSQFPALTKGIEKGEDILKYKDPIQILMKDLSPLFQQGVSSSIN